MEDLNRNNVNFNYNFIQKMVFLCNALNDGWSVKKLNNNKYEFIKNKEN